MAWIVFGLLSLTGLLSVDRLLFAVWMTAYPFADVASWRTRFYERLAVTVLIGVIWIVVLVFLLRTRRRTEPEPGDGARRHID
ncbi:MAG TPA: hypothetical protein VML19_13340 [Verrucomicrobiae bacterium]|nr:hypothetical protein [Verrucomicrobiae bacterium]